MIQGRVYRSIEDQVVSEPELLDASRPGAGNRSVFEVSLNIVNATVGAGVIGLPFALKLAGFWCGLALSCFVAGLTYAAIYTLILCGQRTSIYKFADLSEYAMGRFGYHMLNLMVFVQSAGSCISYFILVADTLPVLLGLYFPQYPHLADRQLITVLVSVIVIFPLNLFRSIGALAHWSAFSVLLLPVMIISVLIRAPAYAPQHQAPLSGIGQDPVAAMGIMSFAFVCSQVAFDNFLTQKNQSVTAWSLTSAISTMMSWTISMLFALCGFLSFGNDVSPNIFRDFPVDDNVINVGRLALGLSMVLTVPMAFYPARDALQKSLGFETADRQPSALQHYSVTVVLFAIFLCFGVNVRSLGKVYSLVGGLSSSFLAYIIPGFAYIVVFHPEWLKRASSPEMLPLIGAENQKVYARPTWWLDVCAVTLVLFGSIVMTFTAISAFQ